MKVRTKQNDGVSPVIGTILLVAITVVLVAIISAVVMGMTSGVGTSHIVGVKVVQGDNVTDTETETDERALLVTITGGDTTSLGKIYVYNGATEITPAVDFTTKGVGQPMSFTGESLTARLASISVDGQFQDGNQTIYTGTINLI